MAKKAQILSLVALVRVLAAASGSVEFKVRDVLTHRAVKGATIAGVPQSKGAPFKATTDLRGNGRIVGIPADEYGVEISAPGYEPMRTRQPVINSDKIQDGGIVNLHATTIPEEERPEVLAKLYRPGYTLIHSYVADPDTGEPIPGVKVRTVKGKAETTTDENGHFYLSTPTPAPTHDYDMVGTDTIIYERPGYKTLIFRNFIVYGDEEGGSAQDMEQGSGVIDIDNTHKLMRNEVQPGSPKKKHKDHNDDGENFTPNPAFAPSPKLYAWMSAVGTPFNVGPRPEANTLTPEATTVTLPTYIRVGHNCTGRTCTGTVERLLLEDYVNNGLLYEWINGWVLDSLKAGAIAYRSYGAWYVAHPISSNYDICDNTNCQVYPQLAKHLTTSLSIQAVNETKGVVVTRTTGATTAIILAEYAAESNDADDTDTNGNWLATCGQGYVGEPTNQWPCMKDFVCNGKRQASTHSRGMCQRGTQRWASGLDRTGPPGDTNGPILNSVGQPITSRDWQCIVHHYYNANGNSPLLALNNIPAGTDNRTGFIQGTTYGPLAYTDVASPDFTIRTASAWDGSGDKLLVTGREPSWEPGGKRLVYVQRLASGNTGLSVINFDGTGNHQISVPVGVDFAGNPIMDFSPAWSPLGDKIAFCSTRSHAGFEVWMVNTDGNGLVQVTNKNGLFNYIMSADGYNQGCFVSWSPDGTKLAFNGDTVYIPDTGAGRVNVYLMNSDGSGVSQFTYCDWSSPNQASVACVNPSWSPDGKVIAWGDRDWQGDTIGGGGIYWMTDVGVFFGPTGAAVSEQPQWSADGQQILYLSSQNGGAWGIWSMSPDGSNNKQVVGGTKKFSATPFNFSCPRCPRFDQ